MEGERRQEGQPQIEEQIRRRAEAVALFMGGDYDMTVGVGPWGSGWHWDFVKNHVNMDAKDLATEPEDVVRGIAAHEGNHKGYSRTESVMDIWQEPGFSFGYNAVEDPRANQGGIKFMPGSKKWIRAYIERDLSSGGGLDYQGMEKSAKDKMGYVPDFMKWGAEMIRHWYEKEFKEIQDSPENRKKFLAGIPDQGVRTTVEKTLGFFDKYYKTLPSSKDEMDVRRMAREASGNFRDNIWPIYQKLVQKSVKDQSMSKMIQDMMDAEGQKGQGQGQSGQSQQGSGESVPFSSLPKDVQDEIRKKVEEAQKEAQKGKEQKSQKGQGQGQGQSGDQNKSGGEGEEGEGQQNEGQGAEGKEGSSKSGKGKIPWDKLSERAKKEAEKAFGNLSKKKQGEYKEAAEKDIKGVEDDANEKLRGKMNDPRSNETHKEREEREGKEGEQGNEKSDSREKAKQMDKKVEEFMEELPENPYFEFSKLPETDAITRKMERELKPVFQPTESPDKRYTSTGLRPSMRRAIQMEADPRKTNIFESKGRPTERAFRFMFLIDLSGSMSGRKILETFKALIPVIENLNKFGIEMEIIGYSDNIPGVIRVYKPFELKKLDRASRDTLGRILRDGQGGTPSLEATKRAYARLVKRISQVQGSHNYLIPLTDGAPTDCSAEDMAKLIRAIRKNKSVVTAGFGIGPDTEYVNESYPLLPNEVRAAIARRLGRAPDDIGNSFSSASEFGEVFAIIAGYMVRRPDLFFK